MGLSSSNTTIYSDFQIYIYQYYDLSNYSTNYTQPFSTNIMDSGSILLMRFEVNNQRGLLLLNGKSLINDKIDMKLVELNNNVYSSGGIKMFYLSDSSFLQLQD